VTRSRRLATLIAALLVCCGLSACGKHQSTGPVRSAETEGIYLDVSDLKYQVEMSRQLNPKDTQDKSLLLGIPEDEQELTSEEVWFAVALRVQNETDEPLLPSESIEIEDTVGQKYEPIELGEENVFAYRADDQIPPRETYPLLDSPAFDSPARGAVLLFKLTLTGLNNRPLELKIEGRKFPKQTGLVNLDV